MTIWAYVLGTSTQFLSLLVNVDEAESQLALASFHVEVNSLMPSLRQYRQTSKQTYGAPSSVQPPQIILDSSAILVEEKRISDEYMRNQIRDAKIAEMKLAEMELKVKMEEEKIRRDASEAETRRIEANNQKEAQKQQVKEAERQRKEAETQKKEAEKLKKVQQSPHNEWRRSYAESFNTTSLCLTVCGCCICWPFIGCIQGNTIDNLNRNGGGLLVSCCITTMCCCVGAAMNRRTIRKLRGINGYCLVDLFLYSLHVVNMCLMVQEMAEGYRK